MVISSNFEWFGTFLFSQYHNNQRKPSLARSNRSSYISWMTFHYFRVIDSVHSIINNEIWNNTNGGYRRCRQRYFIPTYFSKVWLIFLLFLSLCHWEMFVFRKIWRALFSCYLCFVFLLPRFEIRSFVWSLTNLWL